MQYIYEIQQLLSIIPQQRIAQHTRDLHFKWQDNLDNLSKGQLEVLLLRLRKASRKTLEDLDQDAEESMQSMYASLMNIQRLLQTTGTQKDEDDEQPR